MFKFGQQQSQPQVPSFIQDILNRSGDKVEQDIQKAQANKITTDEFWKKIPNFASDNNLDEQTAIIEALKIYQQRGITIEGIDINQELQALGGTQPIQRQMQTQMQPQEEKQGFLSRLNTIPDAVPFVGGEKIFDPGFEGKFNLPLGAVTQVPSAISNVVGGTIGLVDKLDNLAGPNLLRNLTRTGIDNFFTAIGRDPSKLPENLLQDLSQSIIDDGVDTKEKLQEALGVDPDSFMTKAGEFITNVGGTMGIQIGSATKAPQIVQTGLANLQTKAPKLYQTLLSSAGRGAVEAGKFGIVSEGEISPTGVVIGAIANPILQKGSEAVRGLLKTEVPGILQKIIKPTSTKGKQINIQEDMAIIGQSLKANNKRPDTQMGLYEDLTDIMKKLYTNHINPALSIATSKGGKINMSNVADDIVGTMPKPIKGKTLPSIFGKGNEEKQVNVIIQNLRKLKDIDLIQAEQLKQYTSAILMTSKRDKTLTTLQQDVITKLNRQLQDRIEDIVSKLSGSSIKVYKTQYGAIARHLDSLNRGLIREANVTGERLFSGLGKISGWSDIAEGRVKSGLATLLTGEALRLMREPNVLVQKLVRKLYQQGKERGASSIKQGMTGVGASIIGKELDDN